MSGPDDRGAMPGKATWIAVAAAVAVVVVLVVLMALVFISNKRGYD